MKSNKLLKEYSIDIKDCGSSYDVTLENKKTKDVFHIPIMGDVLYFGDIVGFTRRYIRKQENKRREISTRFNKTRLD